MSIDLEKMNNKFEDIMEKENFSDNRHTAPCNIDGVVVSSSTQHKLIDELFQDVENENLTDKELEYVKNGIKKFNELKEATKHEIVFNRD